MTIRGPFAIALLVALGLSLAANLVVLGFAASRVGTLRMGGLDRVVALGLRGYPQEIRRAIAAEALAERGAFAKAIADFTAARQRAFEAMRAEPFDPAALAAAFAEMRARTTVLQELGQQAIGKAIAAAPPDEREKIKPPRALRP